MSELIFDVPSTYVGMPFDWAVILQIVKEHNPDKPLGSSGVADLAAIHISQSMILYNTCTGYFFVFSFPGSRG